MFKIANLVQQEMYRPRLSYDDENSSVRGTQRLYILTLVLWSVVGYLDDLVLAKENASRSRLLSRLPWHNLVAHLPKLHHSLGSLYEILTAEHTGEHSLQPYAQLSKQRSSHHGNFLHDARVATYYQEQYQNRFEGDYENTKTQSLHRGVSSVPVPNLYLAPCCLSRLPLLLPNLRSLYNIFLGYGWKSLLCDYEGGIMCRLSGQKSVDFIFCTGCFEEHNPPNFP